MVERTNEVAAVIDTMKRRSAPYGGPRADLERDPEALAAALDELRLQHEELLFADEELRVQLQELERVGDIVAFERARSQEVFAFAPDAYLVTDEKGMIHEANVAATRLFEREVALLVGKPLSTLIVRDDMPVHYELLERAKAGGALEQPLRVRYREEARALVPTSTIVSKIGPTDSFFWRFRRLEAAPAPAQAPTKASRESAVAKDLRVLVVCHEADTRAVVDIVAGGHGAEVQWTDSMEGALEVLRRFPADIVVADLFIEGADGADLITELRRRSHRPMPVGIALSGVSSADSRRALSAGFHAFLLKPTTLDSVKSAFQAATRVLARRSRRSAKRSEPG